MAEGSKTNIAIRALDVLMAVDTWDIPGLYNGSGAPSILNICHSLGHKTLAMQLAAGNHIDQLVAPHSAKQVGLGCVEQRIDKHLPCMIFRDLG